MIAIRLSRCARAGRQQMRMRRQSRNAISIYGEMMSISRREFVYMLGQGMSGTLAK